MNINASVIDQRVRALATSLEGALAEQFNIKNDEGRTRSAAFAFLCAKTVLDLTDEEALDCLTEGGNDFGVDALDVSDVQDGEFTVTLFQTKYTQDLEATKNFPENGVTKAIQTVRFLFDPDATITTNKVLKIRVEELRSLIRDGHLPRVRFLLCNNGQTWTDVAQQHLDREKEFRERVFFEHVNHDVLLNLLQSTQPVKDALRFQGKAVVEDFNYLRVVVGKMAVTDIADLLRRHGDRLLERNIRRYLGLYGNRVDEGIRATLSAADQRPNFYFYNNGLTLTCTKFDYNALQGADYQLKVEGLQIINGGQTCKTIEATLAQLTGDQRNLDKAFVLVRLYQLPADGADLVRSITYATNSQNPVDLRDLRSNDQRQMTLQASMAELGYQYRRQRSDEAFKSTDITSATAAEAVLSVWRRRPQQAKFMTREHFGKLYDEIFTPQLNGAQVVIATLLFRFAENLRKRPPADSPDFLPYAGAFLAMLMGDSLLADLKITGPQIDHRNFEEAKRLAESKANTYAREAIESLGRALKGLYGDTPVSLQRLSATFRRGDLLEFLEHGNFTHSLFGN